LTLELKATEAGQVGLFPEHGAMLPWLRERVTAARDGERPDVLHLFAYTGLVTLAMAAAGAALVHVDASRPTVAWARRNAELSGLADRPVRWIVDDAVRFAEREVRRVMATGRARARGGSRRTSLACSRPRAACSNRTGSSS
jgi:23S rRNA (cytosine1962-C5)-methyltransferase